MGPETFIADGRGGDWPEIESERAYVVYNPETGIIVHLHRTTTFRGAQGRNLEEDEGQAVELARRFGNEGEFKALAVEPRELETFQPQTEYRVDLDELRVVPDQTSSEPEPQLVDDDDVIIHGSTDAPIFGASFSFRDFGRFARSANLSGVTPNSNVVASMTELTGGPGAIVPFLGGADLRVYNVVPTAGRVTVRGEAFTGGAINIKVMLIIDA